ncbi:hypothetical protein [Methylobacterium sp. P1-11]|uniref:hypothetical protein n=1 Tax=Methylobacterium sp. P1-11 TaxID=2024616 RepID=UPI0011F074CE|nr:hypothetical protein [Methylobacterium sp. P1-11]
MSSGDIPVATVAARFDGARGGRFQSLASAPFLRVAWELFAALVMPGRHIERRPESEPYQMNAIPLILLNLYMMLLRTIIALKR